MGLFVFISDTGLIVIIITVSKQGIEIEVHMQIYFFIHPIPVCWLLFLKLLGPYRWLPLSSRQKKKSVPSVGERTVVLGPLFWLRKTAPGLSVFETDGLSLCFWCHSFCVCVRLRLSAESCLYPRLCTVPSWQFCVFSISSMQTVR